MERNSLFIFTIVFAGCFVGIAHSQITTLWSQQTGLAVPNIIWNAGGWANGTNASLVVETIDDFVVNGTKRWKLTNVTVDGAMEFASAGLYTTFTGWKVKLYTSVNDSTTFVPYTYERPADTPFASYNAPMQNNGGNPQWITPVLGLDSFNIVLNPGRYWLSVYPIISNSNYSITWGPKLRNTTLYGTIGKSLCYIEYFQHNLVSGNQNIYIPQERFTGSADTTRDLSFAVQGIAYNYDITPPVLNKITLNPSTTLDLNSANALTIFANFSDASGISAASLFLRSPSSNYVQLTLVASSGLWGAIYNFPLSSEGGTWYVHNLTAIDAAGPTGFENKGNWTQLDMSLSGNDIDVIIVAANPSSSPTPSTSPTPSVTPSVSPTPSVTPSVTPSTSPSPTASSSATPSNSPSSSASPSPEVSIAASASSSPEAADNKKKSTNTTAIAVGVVLGVVVCGGALVAGLFVFFLRRRKRTNDELHEMAAPSQYHGSQLGLVVRGSEVGESSDNTNTGGSPGSTSGNATPRNTGAYNTIPIETSGNSSGSRGNLNSVLFANRPDDPNNNSGGKQPYHNAPVAPNQGGSTSYGSIPVPRDAPTGYGSIQSVAMLAANRESYEIDYSELEFEKEIGRGAYGVVYKGKWRGGEVAIKQILTRSTITDKEIAEFKAEAALMAKLRPHTNVVQFLGITLGPQLCIVTEFLDHGSLYEYLRNTGKMDATVLATMVKGIAAGMLHLHREGIIHRDLAARNILLGKGYQVKISDFGMSRMTEKGGTASQTKSDTGPLKWMAPESIRSRLYSTKSDVWAFGVTVWEVVTRQEPYADLDAVQTALDVTHNGRRLEIPEYSPPLLKEIMASCFQTNPEDRPDFDIISKKLSSAPMDQWSGPFISLNSQNNTVASPTQQPSGNQGSAQYGSLNDQ